ncbi:MAG: hypothetical protein FVQ81_13125 [Candidatus Glassbacteria bacterium]|nr:hypothetical protein [Candidatus Glassbacteria bacterium]
MNIHVSPRELDRFWEKAPLGKMYWGFKRMPDAKAGDTITFYAARRPIASALISHIDQPGEYKGRKFTIRYRGKSWWKIHWEGESFHDLREEGQEDGFKPNLYGGYDHGFQKP